MIETDWPPAEQQVNDTALYAYHTFWRKFWDSTPAERRAQLLEAGWSTENLPPVLQQAIEDDIQLPARASNGRFTKRV